MAVTGMGTANASPAIALVSTNPVNYTPNINQGAVYKMAEANGMLYAGGSFTHGHRGRRDHAAGHVHPVTHSSPSTRRTGSSPRRSRRSSTATSGRSSRAAARSTSAARSPRSTAWPGAALVKIDATTGAVDTAFNARLTGNVTEAAVVSGRLIVSGTFAKKIAALNLATGADTGYINVPITGSVAANAGPVEVYRFAVNPAGTRLVGVGNFTTVGGEPHARVFMLDLGADRRPP